MDFGSLIWWIFLLSAFQPVVQQRVLLARRLRALHQLERSRGTRAITLIHRQESFSFFGLSFARFIDIDDAEAVLRAIELTGPKVPIDLVLHTPGGLVLAAEQISRALSRHQAKSAVLGPVDPQLGQQPAASILAAVALKDVNKVDDETLILADVSRKAIDQVREAATVLLTSRGMDAGEADKLAALLSEGHWTHDHPITAEAAAGLGLRVSTAIPTEVRDLIRLYPQPRGRHPAVEFFPVPYRTPAKPTEPAAS